MFSRPTAFFFFGSRCVCPKMIARIWWGWSVDEGDVGVVRWVEEVWGLVYLFVGVCWILC